MIQERSPLFILLILLSCLNIEFIEIPKQKLGLATYLTVDSCLEESGETDYSD